MTISSPTGSSPRRERDGGGLAFYGGGTLFILNTLVAPPLTALMLENPSLGKAVGLAAIVAVDLVLGSALFRSPA